MNCRKIFQAVGLMLFAMLVAIGVSMAAEAKEVAEIQDCEGKVKIMKNKAATSDTAYSKTVLSDGDRIIVEKNGKVTVLFYKDMHTERLIGEVQVRMGDNNCLLEKGRKNQVTVGKVFQGIVGVQPIDSLSQKYMGVMQRGGELRIYAPRFRVSSQRPVFDWEENLEADQYEVTIRELTEVKESGDKEGKEILKFKTVKNSVEYPQDKKPLSYGKKYLCEVKVFKKGATPDKMTEIDSGTSKFSVATESEAEAIKALKDEVQSSLKQNPEDLSPHFLLFSYYLDKEFVEDAYALSQKLIEKRSDDKNLKIWIETLKKCREKAESLTQIKN